MWSTRLFWRSLQPGSDVCPVCESVRIEPAGPGLISGLLGLRRWRCLSCRRILLSRGQLAETTPRPTLVAVGPPSSSPPPRVDLTELDRRVERAVGSRPRRSNTRALRALDESVAAAHKRDQ